MVWGVMVTWSGMILDHGDILWVLGAQEAVELLLGVSSVLSPCARHPLRAEPAPSAELSMGAGTPILQAWFRGGEGRELCFARAQNPQHYMEVSLQGSRNNESSSNFTQTWHFLCCFHSRIFPASIPSAMLLGCSDWHCRMQQIRVV